MAKRSIRKNNEQSERHVSARFQELLRDLESEDEGTKAQAVRDTCPCRSAWGVPVQRYLYPMLDEKIPQVNHELEHVLFQDSSWGRKGEHHRIKEATEAALDAGDEVGPYGIANYHRNRPRVRQKYYARRGK
jgi:hypothetical protein